MDIHGKILHAFTAYDRKQQGKRGYNPYALGHYCKALESVDEAIASGQSPREAIVANFVGRLLDVVLVGCGMAKATDDEHRYRRY